MKPFAKKLQKKAPGHIGDGPGGFTWYVDYCHRTLGVS